MARGLPRAARHQLALALKKKNNKKPDPPELREQRWQAREQARRNRQARYAVFPFFKLPRELRDAIYELSLQNYKARDILPGLIFAAHGVSSTSLMLVSHQFSHEYRERTSKRGSLIITNPGEPFDLKICGSNFNIPNPALALNELHLNLRICNLSEPALHHRWIKDLLLKLPAVQTLTVCAVHENNHEDLFYAALRKTPPTSSMPCLSSYKVYIGVVGVGDFPVLGRQVLEWSDAASDFIKPSASKAQG